MPLIFYSLVLGGAYLELLHADSLAVISCLLESWRRRRASLGGWPRNRKELLESPCNVHVRHAELDTCYSLSSCLPGAGDFSWK